MSPVLILLWIAALGTALAAIGLGRNLTRSIVAGIVSLAIIGLVLVGAGIGHLAFAVLVPGVLALALIQVFGWMLVDIDRDHLPPTDPATTLARGLAFLLVGGGLAALLVTLVHRGELEVGAARIVLPDPVGVGSFLFGSAGGVATLLGLTIAASLLACLSVLRDEGD